MKVQRLAALGLGIVVSLAAFGVGATPRTYYDPSSHKWITYDPDKVRGDATGATAAPSGTAPAVYGTPDRKFNRQVVSYQTTEAPGTIIIDTSQKFLYFVMPGGKAMRIGVGVGREGFGWTGTVHVGAKQMAPKWFPPPEMVARQPELAKYQAEGMSGGQGNPLGEAALYLYNDKGKDTLYRIHGTIEPNSIGHNVSSGCIRMLNENILTLYDEVSVGTKVVVM